MASKKDDDTVVTIGANGQVVRQKLSNTSQTKTQQPQQKTSNNTVVTMKNGKVVREPINTSQTTSKPNITVSQPKINTSTNTKSQKPTTPLVYQGASINPNAPENEKLRITANNNYNQKLSAYKKAEEDYKAKRENELTSRGISADFLSRFDVDAPLEQKLTKLTREEAKKRSEDAKIYRSAKDEIQNALRDEEQAISDTYNQLKYAKYLKNYSDVENGDINLYDRTLGQVFRGAQDMFSTFTDDNRYVDENGNTTYLPTYNQLKQAKVQDSYGNDLLGGLARFGGDVAYQGAKLGTSIGLNAVAPLSGTALYFTDIYADQYKDNINAGMDNEGAMLNAFLKTGQNYIKQKLIGGIGGKLTGGDTSALENALSRGWAKIASNPKVVSALSSMSAEAIDEFTDTYMETLIDVATRDDVDVSKLMSPDTFLEALYSGAVGGATGAMGGVNPNSLASAQNAINQQMSNQNMQQNIQPNIDTQIQAKAPQIQQEQQNNINNQPIAEETQIESKQVNNNTIDTEQNLIYEINNEQRKLDNGTSEDDGYHLAELQKELQEVQKKSIANDSNAFNLAKIDENNTLKSIRTTEDISNRKVNAYQYDNPEVKPFFKDAAYDLKSALENFTTKGERRMHEDGSFGGSKFTSTPQITELKEDYNMSYKDLDKGINGIIKDEGQENNAASKKVEIVIDKMLRNGYKSETPDTVRPNQNYLDTLAGKPINNQINEQVNEELPFFEADEVIQPTETSQNMQQNVQPNIDTQIQTETPQIQQNEVENINNQPRLEQQQMGLDGGLNEEKQSNIAETKSEDALKITNKETSKKVADNLTKAIEGRNDSQNVKEIVRNIEQETGKPMRNWVETSTTATGTTELINSMNKEKITYKPTSNKENIESAKKELSGLTYEQYIQKAKDIVNSDKRLKSTDIALLELVTKEALDHGDMNTFIDLVQDTAILGTESGQVVQALSLIRQSDPTTQLSTLQKLIEREQSKGNKVYDGVQIKPEMVEKVLNSYNEDGTWNQEKFDNSMDELKQDIANQMHVRPTEKLNAWRYLSMLGNPKTHIRNIVANIAMKGLQGGKNKIAAGIEAIAPINKLNKLLGGNAEATRGKTLKQSTKDVKNYANATIDSYFKEHKQGSKYNETMGTLKGELESRRNIFNDKTSVGKTLNQLEKANAKALDLEDVKFNKGVARNSFANFLTANGIETQTDIDNNPELVAQALDYALFKGQEATFHQYSQTGTSLRNFRESLRQGSNLTRTLGLGMDATLPFINTPINIAKTGIEYTPGLGILKTISDVQKAPKNLKADVLIDSLSKQFMGGMLAAVGYGLAKEGILNGKGGEDKEDKLEKNLGKQDYSVNILGNTFDLSWLSPSAMPMFVGVELYNATKNSKGVSPDAVMNLLTSTIDPLSEMSVISSVTEALQSYSRGTQALGDIGASALTSYISQYIPTLASQVATVFDDTQRNSSGDSLGEKIVNQVKYKIPGLRNTLPAQTNVWGEEKKYASNPFIRSVEAFLSPANRKEVKVDDTTKEIERVYENTGSGLPSLSLTKTPKIDTETYNLSSNEYTQYKKDYGKNAKDMLDDLMKTDDYKNASDVEKSKMISAIYEYSTYMARKKIADENNLKFEYKKSNGKSYNYPKYYMTLNKNDFAEYVADKYKDYDE